MAFLGVKDTLEEKVKMKLVHDASAQKTVDNAKKAQQRKEEGIAKAKEDEEKRMAKVRWKQVKPAFNKARDQGALEVGTRMLQTWSEWNTKKREMTQQKATPEEMDEAKKMLDNKEEADLTVILDSYGPIVDDYIEAAKAAVPDVGKNLTHENQIQLIKTKGIEKFNQLVAQIMKLQKAKLKVKQAGQLKQFDADKISQELANIPLKIEEKVDEIKDKLELLLGKILSPLMQPDSPKFDIDVLIAQIMAFLNPVIAACNPLMSVVGNIPVIGDIAGMLAVMSANAGPSKLTKEEIQKLVPQKPDLDQTLYNKVMKVTDDIIAFCMTLPTILIQLIFEMINVIYSKLKIITSIIPLGGMFPLTLIDAAIEATPKILKLIKVLPGMMWDCMTGLITDKLAEAMALAQTLPNIDPNLLVSLAPDIEVVAATKKSEAPKRKDYNDVTREMYESTFKKFGYTQFQIKNIQKNYLKIYNGTGTATTKIIEFVDNGKDQVLPSNAITDDKNTKEEPGFTQIQIERRKPSVEDYEEYLKTLAQNSNLAEGLWYERMKPTKKVMGEWYSTYKNQISQYGIEVILKEKMKPARDPQKQEVKEG